MPRLAVIHPTAKRGREPAGGETVGSAAGNDEGTETGAGAPRREGREGRGGGKECGKPHASPVPGSSRKL
jgi:hypothetical protein